MKADLLFEIGTEELPARALETAIKQISECAKNKFDELHLVYENIESAGTPRRVVLIVRGLAGQQPDRTIEARGPSKKAAFEENGEPTKAAEGFARAQGVLVADLELRDTEQGSYVYAVRGETGKSTVEILAEILPDLVTGLSFEKSMRWGNGEIRFARPIRWLLALYGSQKIGFAIEAVKSGDKTFGHRFLSPGPIKIGSASEYFAAMRSAFVIVDSQERADVITKMIMQKAAENSVKPVIHEKVFNEVINLVENPNAVYGTFDREFLSLPREVLETAMESHQRYFPVEDAKRDLAAGFIAVHNGDPACADTIRKGNERVLRARLADAKFFFFEDQKLPLAEKVKSLAQVIFQEKLGTLLDKTNRVIELAGRLADFIVAGEDVRDIAQKACRLAKADLVSSMVIEFPVLQGVIGREYAKLSGEGDAVAQAIFEHYLPRFAGDILPESEAGAVASIADKIDTIAGCLAIGLVPSGSEDPYMLRRFSRGIIDIVRAREYRFSIVELFGIALGQLTEAGIVPEVVDVNQEFADFITGRMRQYLLKEEFAYDTVEAVLSLGIVDIVDTIHRTEAVHSFRNKEDMDSLLVGFNRCRNLSKNVIRKEVDPSLFVEDDENVMHKSLTLANTQLDDHLAKEDYEKAMQDLASLRPIIDGFFDRVLVMTDDEVVKSNRLNLLRYAVETFDRVTDFSKIVVAGN